MKEKNIFLISLMIILVSGCFVKSLHPFYREKDLLFKKELLGTWTGDDSSEWKIEQNRKFSGIFKPDIPENVYLITYTDKKGTSQFIVNLFKLGNRLFLDFYPEEKESSNELRSLHLVAMHTVARVDLAPDKMIIRWYNEEWLIGLFKQNKIRIAHEKVPYESGKIDDNFQVILTASTGDLQKFMLKYAEDPNAFKNDYTFILRKTNQ
ncbi:MAG: hypothetical protein Q8M08_02620 [Bacteroidales bacterium]|nr:hypothetical protein [Bacteroidales bacterium]